jgi:outer membrane protein assembly factor BamB
MSFVVRRTVPSAISIILSLTVFCSARAWAEDWPQWMGPKRDNVIREEGLLEKFPEGGPKLLWRATIANGYAGPAVAKGKVYVTDFATDANVKVDNFARKAFEGKERVLCLDEKTGRELWKHEYPVTTTVSYPAGPRCTPTVDGDKVYFLGAEGNLLCMGVDEGNVIWEKNLKSEYKTTSALWGYASHPLVDGNKLLCVVGGTGSHMVAFDKNTGKELWKNLTSKEQGYSPPTILEFAGKRQLICCRPDAVTSLDVETGEELWTTPYEATNGSIIMSPLLIGEHLFIGGYSDKNLMLKMKSDKPGVEVVFKDKVKVGVAPINVQPIVVENTLYGFDQSGELMAVEIPSGKRLWSTPAPVSERKQGSGTAFINKAGDRYFFFNELGEVVIGTMDTSGYKEIDRAKVIEPTNNAFMRDVVWCAPAYANKHMYVRNDSEIICVDLAK